MLSSTPNGTHRKRRSNSKLRKNAQKYKQSKRKQKNGTAESICHTVSPSTAHGLPALSQVRLVRGSFNLISPSEPEPVSLSRDSQQPVVGRLTGLDRFSGLNLHLDALLVRTNGLIQGVRVSNASPILHKRIVQRTVP